MDYTYKNIWLLLLLILCCFSKQVKSNIDLKFQHISLKDGLSTNQYNSYIFEDSRGFVWISSTDGLNRFDGLKVKNYRFEAGLKDTNIQSNFFEDKTGKIWFASYRAINCYWPSLDSIKTYQVQDRKGNIIQNGYRAFYLDTLENKLWIKAASHIFKLDVDNTEKFEQLAITTNAFKFKLSTNVYGKPKSLAMVNRTNQLQLLDFENENSVTYQVPYHNNVVHLQKDKWLLFKADKWCIFDEAFPQQIRYLNNEPKFKIFDAIKLNEDTIIVATQNNGLYLFDWKKEKFLKNWKNKINQNFTLSSNAPRELYLSKSGYLFMSHRNKGVDFAYIKKRNFSNPLEQHINKNVAVSSIFESKDGNIWVSTKQEGVFVFDFIGEFIHHYKYPFDEITTAELYQVTQNKKGDILGITAKAIYKFDIQNKTVKNIIAKSDSLWFWYMTSVFSDRDFISSSNGVLQLVEEGKDKYILQPCPELSQFEGASFQQMYTSSNEQLLIPYGAKDLLTFSITMDSLKLIKHDSCSLEFYDFFESKQRPQTIWTGTSKGLKLVDANNNIQTVFNKDIEIGSGNVFGVVEDVNGNLWLSTNKGIWNYDPNNPNKKPIHFQELDGLSGDLFSRYYSAIAASNGEIWMGNNKGLVKFNPSEIEARSNIPKVYIEELLINDTQRMKGVSEQDTLQLNYGDNTLTFSIKAVNLYKATANKIYYQLEGYDENWLQINNGEKIRYTKIKPGQYNLKVQAADANGNKSTIKQLLILKIKPPYWQTWWFRVLCALLILLLLYAIYSSRVRQVVKRETLKSQVLEVEMKALRAQMNPHFLFNALNSIKSLIINTKEKEASEYLSKFSTLLRSILNNSEKKKIILKEEIEALRLYIDLESLRFSNDFNYQIQVDKTIDESFVRIPPLILQPFVENAIWHGLLPKKEGHNKLNINVIAQNDFLIFEIEDNGVGRKTNSKEVKTKKRKSMGIEITQKRIELLHPKNKVQIIDLVGKEKEPLGTKVVIKIFAPE